MFGVMLNKCRKILDLTQRELSDLLNIPQSKVAKLENGSQNPDPETIKKLSDFFNVKIDFLFGKETFTDYFNLLMEKSGLSLGDISDISGYEVDFIIDISEGHIPMLRKEELLILGNALNVNDFEKWLTKNTDLNLSNMTNAYYFFDENNVYFLGKEQTSNMIGNIMKDFKSSDRKEKAIVIDLYKILEKENKINIDDQTFNINLYYNDRSITNEEIDKLKKIHKAMLE